MCLICAYTRHMFVRLKSHNMRIAYFVLSVFYRTTIMTAYTCMHAHAVTPLTVYTVSQKTDIRLSL